MPFRILGEVEHQSFLQDTLMENTRRIALVAHDNRMKDLMEWIEWNRESLLVHRLICTSTTGKLVEEVLKKNPDKLQEMKINIRKLKSGSQGEEQQLGSIISEVQSD